jgi:Carboxypeptidase regulatory-like domain
MNVLISVLLAAFVAVPAPVLAEQANQPVPAVSTPQTGQSAGGAQAESAAKSLDKKKATPGFLIIGTVFDERALSFPGVQVRIRRMDQKRFRWETYSNSRGEFAVRVPEGFDYEVVVRAKHYQDQSKSVRTNSGDIQQRLSIRLEPVNPGKTGAKS